MMLRAKLAVAVLAAAPLILTGSVANAAPAKATAAQEIFTQCDGIATFKAGRGGWTVTTPVIWESAQTNCNLKPGDLPYRDPKNHFGLPGQSIKVLQRNLNYCYGSKLAVDGTYGSKTAAAVKAVQRKHKLTADGIYGPKTRSAMNWRLYNPAKKIWTKTCSSPI